MAAPDPDESLLAALCHPLRRRILRLMPEEDGEPVSPRDLAIQLDEALTHVSYHVRVLAECGAAKQVRARKINGSSTQHFYRRTIEATWAREILARPEPGRAGGDD
jgi:DNA-binding transcriptional ArsR family regulator